MNKNKIRELLDVVVVTVSLRGAPESTVASGSSCESRLGEPESTVDSSINCSRNNVSFHPYKTDKEEKRRRTVSRTFRILRAARRWSASVV